MNFKIKSYAYIAIFVSTWLTAQQTTGVVMDTDGIALSDVEIFEENTTQVLFDHHVDELYMYLQGN